MLFQDAMFGSVAAPDDATPEEVYGALAPLRQQAQERSALFQGVGALGRMVGDTFSPGPPRPAVVSPAAAMAMGPNYQSFVRQQEAQAAQDMEWQQRQRQSAIEQRRMSLAEKAQLAQSQQAALEHADRLAHQDLLLKNQEKEHDLSVRRIKLDEAKAEREKEAALKPKVDAVGTRGSYFVIDPKTGLPTFNQSEHDKQYEQASIAHLNRIGTGGGGADGGGMSDQMIVHPLMEEDKDGNIVAVPNMGWMQGSRGVRIPVRRTSDGSWLRMSSTEGPSQEERIAKSVLLENRAADSAAGQTRPMAGAPASVTAQYKATRDVAAAELHDKARIETFKKEHPGEPIPPPDDETRFILNNADRAARRAMRYPYPARVAPTVQPNAVAQNAPQAVKNSDGTYTLPNGDQMTGEEYAKYKAKGGKL